jgi:hypothetical protein
MKTTFLNLPIDNNKLNHFCEQLQKHSANGDHAQDKLATLEAFITQFGQDNQESEAYRDTLSVLNSYSDKSRKQLLADKAKELATALRSFNAAAITAVCLPLSRSGFNNLLPPVLGQFTALELSFISDWVRQWMEDAAQRSRTFSRFPEVPDLINSGINPQEYRTMTELGRQLKVINEY